MRIRFDDIKSEGMAIEALVWEVVNISIAKHFDQAHYSSSRDDYNKTKNFAKEKFSIDVAPYNRVVESIMEGD